jgi:hypothetical protein
VFSAFASPEKGRIGRNALVSWSRQHNRTLAITFGSISFTPQKDFAKASCPEKNYLDFQLTANLNVPTIAVVIPSPEGSVCKGFDVKKVIPQGNSS